MAKSRIRFKLESRDRGYEKIKEEILAGARGAYVKVGLMGDVKDSHAGEELDSVALGIVHEFGSPAANIPERSWLRSAVEKYRGNWELLRYRLVALIYEGKITISRSLGLLGAQASVDVKRNITEGPPIPPPNTPATVARKLGLTGGHLERLQQGALAKAAFGTRVKSSRSLSVGEQHGEFRGKGAALKKANRPSSRETRIMNRMIKTGDVSGAGDRTLVDSGRMVGDITWSVVMGEGKGD